MAAWVYANPSTIQQRPRQSRPVALHDKRSRRTDNTMAKKKQNKRTSNDLQNTKQKIED